MHNAALAELGLDWRYLAFEVHPDDLRSAILGAKAMNFIGLNLTVPHKLLALDMVDVLDESAKTWGAVNTIRFEGKDGSHWRPLGEFVEPPREIRSHGFNTDADALSRALREDLGLDLSGTKVLLLGAGGAGRATALKLASESVSKLFLVNRTRSKAEAIAAEIQERYSKLNVKLGFPLESVDLVLNATSLGLKANDTMPLDLAQFPLDRAREVYDMIYRPAETPLLAAARQAGCRTANGLGMLLYQGAKAFGLWTGRSAPVAVMRKALEQNVYV